MVDAAVPRTRQEESLTRGGEPSTAAVPHVTAPFPRALVILWVAMVVGIVAFLAFGSVRIGAGNWNGRRMPVREIWSRFVRYLVEEGASAAIVLGVTVAAVFALVSAALMLWQAFALNDAPNDVSPDNAAER